MTISEIADHIVNWLQMSTLTVFFLLIFLGSFANAEDNVPKLFNDTQAQSYVDLKTDSAKQYFNVNKKVLTDLASKSVDSISVNVFNENIAFKKIKQKKRKKTSTWIGNAESSDTRMLLTIGDGHFYGRVMTEDGVILFEPGGAPYEIVSYPVEPGYQMQTVNDAVLPPADLPFAYDMMQPVATGQVDDGARIDVMILYTTGMAAAHPGSQIHTRIQNLIDVANYAFDNSQVNTQINLVYSASVNYPDDTAPYYPAGRGRLEALTALQSNTGVFANVENLRTTYSADQVTLLRQFVDEGCGMGYLLTSNNPRYAYTVVHDGSKTDLSGYYCTDLTYAHEFGHNLGCAHDRNNSNSPGRYSDSYGYQDQTGGFISVMAYWNGCSNCSEIPYFSNPKVGYNGRPTGVLNSENNARTINYTRTEMAGYRTSVPVASDSQAMPWLHLLLK